jgi:hypothetical protein
MAYRERNAVNETSASAIAVVRMRMPYVDRRSLSEAWFSAFHPVSREGAHGAEPIRARSDASLATTVRQTTKSQTRATAGYPTPGVARYGPDRARSEIVPIDVKKSATLRSQRVQSHAVEMCSRSYPPRRTSLTVGLGRERVQLVLRREGAVLHVIAVCRPEVAALVRRALAAADAYVRGTGDTLRATVQTTHGNEVLA